MKKYLQDIVPVVVGILLALFINSWQQSVSEKKYIQNSVVSIIKENRENIHELEYALERQVTFMDTLGYYLNEKDLMLSDIIQKVGGVYTPDLKSTTWKFLIQDSKHTLVTYEFINQLAEIEKYEALVIRYNEKIGDIIFQQAFFTDPELKKVCYILFSDFGSTEMNMINQLKQFNDFAISTYHVSEKDLAIEKPKENTEEKPE